MSGVLEQSAERAPITDVTEASPRAAHFYRVIWRWHFYAGLLVVPFMVILAVTGIIYLFKPQLDTLMYPLTVAPSAATVPPSAQIDAALAAYPGATFTGYETPEAADRAALVKISDADGVSRSVFVNPASGQVLGDRNDDWNLQQAAMTIHGSLLLGDTGDYLVELAACWALVLMVSGLYLWWPRTGSKIWGVLLPRLNRANRRVFWRDLHAVPGFWGALIIVFMILSGLPWATFWGNNVAKVWATYPAQLWDDVPLSDRTAASLNTSTDKTVPWAVEHTPLPASDPHAGHGGSTANTAAPTSNLSVGAPVTLDRVVAFGQGLGLPGGFSVVAPDGEEGVYTLSIAANRPTDSRTLHIDQYFGRVLADIGWQQYGAVPKVVETGIALHEGRYFGLLNQLLMLAAALIVILLAVTGTTMWWQRRPARGLGAPSMPRHFPLWKGAVAIIVVMGILFPLVGISLLVVLLLDFLLIQRVPALRTLVG